MAHPTTTETETELDHPIPDEYVHESWIVTQADVHKFLSEVDDYVTEDAIQGIDAATEFDNYFENDHACAAYTDVEWEEIFNEIGLAFESGEHSVEYANHAQHAVRRSHGRFAVNELGMDHNQPMSILVASKDE